MATFSEDQQESIILDYLGPAGTEENPRCPLCGELLNLAISCGTDRRTVIEVLCPACRSGFAWHPDRPQETWLSLHLEYFMECRQMNQTLRCPFDDCYIIYTEFSDGVLEFRCPYCNRRGRAKPFDILAGISGDEDFSQPAD